MKKMLILIFSTITVIVLSFAWYLLIYPNVLEVPISSGETLEEKLTKIDGWFKELEEDHKFNGAVAIIKEGKPLLVDSYGFTDYQMGTELTLDSSMRLGSVSKQFTALGIMILKEQGKLAYDNSVSDYIASFPYKEVTIRHLLNQTSGIPEYIPLAEQNKERINILTNEKVLDLLISENIETTSVPNQQFHYSNTNYVLLALVIERISGQSFETFMKQELFDPLGMKNTRVWNLLSSDKDFPNKTASFKNSLSVPKEVLPTFFDGVSGDGSIFSSINDMVIWDSFWSENKLISEENLSQAFIRPVLNNGMASDYGFGWLMTDSGMWHNGSWLGARTMISRNLEDDITYILLDNSSNIFFDSIDTEISSALEKL